MRASSRARCVADGPLSPSPSRSSGASERLLDHPEHALCGEAGLLRPEGGGCDDAKAHSEADDGKIRHADVNPVGSLTLGMLETIEVGGMAFRETVSLTDRCHSRGD